MGKSQEFLDAARKGDERTVEKIIGQITKRSGQWTTSLRKGPGVNVKDDNGYTPLHHACLHGHKVIVRLLLSADASPCVVDKKGATPLHLAAFKGDSDVVAMLLAHNNPPVNVDQLTTDHETALLIAAHFGYVDVVAQLIAKGADVSIKNNNDESALDLAAQYGRLETVQHLLRVRPQLVEPYKLPQSRSWVFPSTPLHRASKNGRKEVVAALIAAGVDPNIRTHNGTPLHEAACFGKSSVVRMLLSTGADLDAVDSEGRTVLDLLADYSEEATRRVRRVIREFSAEFENMQRNTYESEEDLPPFPVPDYSPTGYQPSNIAKAPETQKNTNKNKSLLPPSSSSLTKNHSQSFVKKLASKCMGLKAKFNSAPNISNSQALEAEVDAKNKVSEHKTNTHTLLIGNSKFFKILSKKEESGEIVCTDEFDTISLDRISTLNRDSVVNKSNRSCPGFKTSLPNISENNELSDSENSDGDFVVVDNVVNNNIKISKINEAFNPNPHHIFEPRTTSIRMSVTSNISGESENLVNECYESYEFSKLASKSNSNSNSIPKPLPRPNIETNKQINQNNVYENVVVFHTKTPPIPAARIHIPTKTTNELKQNVLYENVSLMRDKKPSPFNFISTSSKLDENRSRSTSRASTISSDSMIDESNLEDILLSQKSKSFRHSKNSEIYSYTNKSVVRTKSNASDSSDVTEASAIENVDCSQELEQNIYTSMTGTLPNKKTDHSDKKHVLFRHKTFTNIDLDKSSHKADLPKWNNEFLKETLAHYHIRGTGHCIYTAPTVTEFIYIFNRETLYKPVPPFTKVTNNNRDSYFETAICFCKPKLPKYHSSAEDLLDVCTRDEKDKVSIDMNALNNKEEMKLTSFRCFCDSKTCTFHSEKRESGNLIVKFSVIKKSISTPNITLDTKFSTSSTSGLLKNKSVSSNLEEPYAVVDITNIVSRNNTVEDKNDNNSAYVSMSQHTTLSSSSSNGLYSVKDIAEVISLSDTSTSTPANPCASDCTIRKSGSSEYSEQWSLQSCESNVTIQSDASFVTCFEDSSEDSDDTLHTDEEVSDAETVTSEVNGTITRKPWIHSDSFRFDSKKQSSCGIDTITEETNDSGSSKFESGISVRSSETSSSECEEDDIPRASDVSLGTASLERDSGVVGAVRSGSGRRRWDETEGTSEGDALSVSSAASSCAPLHMTHHHEYSKVSPTPPKKPPRRNLSVSPTHANSPSSGYSYELRPHARSQDDLDDIQGSKHYLKHGRSVDQYVDGKLSYSEYEDNHNSPRIVPVPNPRPSLKNRSQPVAITAMYENVVIKEQNPRRKLRRNNFAPPYENYEPRMNDNRVRKYSNQERSSLESLLDDQSMNSPSDCERYYDGQRVELPLSPTHYEQPPTPDHPPPSAKQAENSIHERIRPLSQLIMEVVEEIRVRKKSQGDITESNKNS